MKKIRALTLVEILVVLAIIAVLAAILFPTFSSARRKAMEGKCVTQLQQIGLAIQMYRSESDDMLPNRLSDLYPVFVTNAAMFRCPLDGKDGHHPWTGRMEGDRYLPSGVSYTYVPNWKRAIDLGWWNAPPGRGVGKWDDQTPLVECHWHWAKKFLQNVTEDDLRQAKGNAVIVRKDGSIRFWPAKVPIEQYEP